MQEILSLARSHDELLKATRLDLLRAETTLHSERRWKWLVIAASVAAGAVGLAATQNQALMKGAGEFFAAVGFYARGADSGAGNTMLVMLIATFMAIAAIVFLVRRALQKPSPQETARKLMEEFARKEGVAAYVFADDNADDVAASIGNLTRRKRLFEKERTFNPMTRNLAASMTSMLNRMAEEQPHPARLH